MYQQRRRQQGFGVLLLAYQVFGGLGIRYIPPVTLCLVGLQAAIYLRLFKLPWYSTTDACVSAYTVWYRGDYKRLLYAAVEHGDDMHLYYNMMSFIIKGQTLERRFTGPKFLYLTTMFAVITNAVLVGLSVVLSDYDYSFVSQCSVGFSGVIFALKVLTTHYHPSHVSQIMGIPLFMPAKYAVWVELILIQLMVPNASFLGHLSGILVGIGYVKGPLRPILDGVYSLLETVILGATNPRRPRLIPRAEATGYRSQTRHSAHFDTNLDEEEQIRLATEASLRESSGSARPSSSRPNLDDVRSRRVGHFRL